MDQQPNAMNAPQATPSNEEMEMHNRLYSLSVALLYDKAFIPKAAEVFEKAPTPAAGAATLLVTIGTRLIASAQQQGMEIPGTAFLSAGAMVMQEIAEFAETQLGVKMSPDQIEGAFYSAADQMQTIVKKRGGVRVDVSPEDRAQMAQGGVDPAAQQKMASAMMPQPQPPARRGLGG